MKDFIEVNMDEKLNLLMCAINKVNTNFHRKLETLQKSIEQQNKALTDRVGRCETAIDSLKKQINDQDPGVLPRITDAETMITDMSERLEALKKKTANLTDQVALLAGTIQVHDRQLVSQQSKTIDLTARSMQNNLIIMGITKDSKDENCRQKVMDVIVNKMDLEICEKDIEVAHRLGKKDPGKNRPMIVRCHPHLRQKIFDHTKNLKGKKNENDEFYYVKPQHPEPINTERKETQQKVREIQQMNSQIDDDSKKVDIAFK